MSDFSIVEKLDGLTPKQQKVLQALLQGDTITTAAKRAQVSRETVYVWLGQDGFKDALLAGQRDRWHAAMSQLSSAAEKAIGVLVAIAEDEKKDPAVRVKASEQLLRFGADAFVAANLSERLKSLEAKFSLN